LRGHFQDFFLNDYKARAIVLKKEEGKNSSTSSRTRDSNQNPWEKKEEKTLAFKHPDNVA